jgi:hypothetical protein
MFSPSFDHKLEGHGFGPSSSGDSPLASLLDARGPSVSFAPTVSMCGVPSAAPQLITAVLPAPCLPTVPACNRALVDSLRPLAKLPPNFTKSFTSSTTSSPLFSPAGSLMALLVHDGPSRPAPFDFVDADGDMDVLLPDSLRGPPSLRSVTWVVTCPCVLGFCGDGCLYAHINLTALASSKSPGFLINGGANICFTGDLGLLTDLIVIPPMPILVALQGEITIDDCCTACGTIPLLLDDGSIYWQDCYYSKNAVETIIFPQAIVNLSDVFQSWHQSGYRIGDPTPGHIKFNSHDGLIGMSMTLVHHEGLHYCPTDVYTIDHTPATQFSPAVRRVAHKDANAPVKGPACSRFVPTTKAKQVKSEVWLLCLGSPGVGQLNLLPGCVTRIPSTFCYHSFHYINHKEQASIKKLPAQPSLVRTSKWKRRFYMDFSFMRASATDYSCPHKLTDQVVSSYDGYTSYLLIIDEASGYAWVFLTKSKNPPLNIVQAFLRLHGHMDGGCIHMDQGGELASSFAFGDLVLKEFGYTLEPTGADSPSQNGAVEIYNDKLGICTCSLLYGSVLPAKYLSAALIHAVYLHN